LPGDIYFAARHRASFAQDFQAFVITRSQPGPLRNTVLKQNDRGAEPSGHF
jgi:hypothetical protein